MRSGARRTHGASRRTRPWYRFAMQRLLLVDGHSNLYRAFFAIRGGLAAPDGTPTNAAYGFLRMQHKMLRELAPSHVAVAFDTGGETFRTRLDERYKAHRPPMPEELRVQVCRSPRKPSRCWGSPCSPTLTSRPTTSSVPWPCARRAPASRRSPPRSRRRWARSL